MDVVTFLSMVSFYHKNKENKGTKIDLQHVKTRMKTLIITKFNMSDKRTLTTLKKYYFFFIKLPRKDGRNDIMRRNYKDATLIFLKFFIKEKN